MIIRQNEKKKAKFRVSFLFLFIFASFAVCFVLYMKEDFEISSDMIEPAEEAVVYVEPVGTANTVINPVPACEKADASYYDDAVFIGNTVLAGLSDYGYSGSAEMFLSDSIDLGNFDTVTISADGVESGIADAVLRAKAGKVYIMVGIDDIGSEFSFDGLKTVIDSIEEQTGAEVYLMSLLPITAENESRLALNSDIDAYNSALLDLADQINVHYIDVNTAFKGNDGKLSSADAELNGIRLKKSGYERLSDQILTHIG